MTVSLSWRYSKLTIGPDFAYFNLWSLTGARYGRDFPDCKTPLIHLWFLGISKVVGKSTARILFAHHLLLGLGASSVLFFGATFWQALALVMLVNSGWLLAFHGNVGQHPAIFLVLALLTDGWVAAVFIVMATVWNVKLAPTALVMGLINGYWWQAGIVYCILLIIIIVSILAARKPEVLRWLIESVWIIPQRIQKLRTAKQWYPWAPPFTSRALLYILPWVFAGVYSKPELLYWLPAIVFVILSAWGKVIRPNHLLPLVAWIAIADIPPLMVVTLVAIDIISGGLYLPDLWERFYNPGFSYQLENLREVGERLYLEPGTLWVNGIGTSVYAYAQKPPTFGMVEQIEIREVSPERRKIMQQAWFLYPPDWVVETPTPMIDFDHRGYLPVGQYGEVKVWRRKV